eukprot:363150-Chlamydomonas_euryale.AAC.3
MAPPHERRPRCPGPGYGSGMAPPHERRSRSPGHGSSSGMEPPDARRSRSPGHGSSSGMEPPDARRSRSPGPGRGNLPRVRRSRSPGLGCGRDALQLLGRRPISPVPCASGPSRWPASTGAAALSDASEAHYSMVSDSYHGPTEGDAVGATAASDWMSPGDLPLRWHQVASSSAAGSPRVPRLSAHTDGSACTMIATAQQTLVSLSAAAEHTGGDSSSSGVRLLAESAPLRCSDASPRFEAFWAMSQAAPSEATAACAAAATPTHSSGRTGSMKGAPDRRAACRAGNLRASASAAPSCEPACVRGHAPAEPARGTAQPTLKSVGAAPCGFAHSYDGLRTHGARAPGAPEVAAERSAAARESLTPLSLPLHLLSRLRVSSGAAAAASAEVVLGAALDGDAESCSGRRGILVIDWSSSALQQYEQALEHFSRAIGAHTCTPSALPSGRRPGTPFGSARVSATVASWDRAADAGGALGDDGKSSHEGGGGDGDGGTPPAPEPQQYLQLCPSCSPATWQPMGSREAGTTPQQSPRPCSPTSAQEVHASAVRLVLPEPLVASAARFVPPDFQFLGTRGRAHTKHGCNATAADAIVRDVESRRSDAFVGIANVSERGVAAAGSDAGCPATGRGYGQGLPVGPDGSSGDEVVLGGGSICGSGSTHGGGDSSCGSDGSSGGRGSSSDGHGGSSSDGSSDGGASDHFTRVTFSGGGAYLSTSFVVPCEAASGHDASAAQNGDTNHLPMINGAHLLSPPDLAAALQPCQVTLQSQTCMVASERASGSSDDVGTQLRDGDGLRLAAESSVDAMAQRAMLQIGIPGGKAPATRGVVIQVLQEGVPPGYASLA